MIGHDTSLDADELSLSALSEFLDGRGVAVFKRPEYLDVVDELPRTEVGKIDKATLEDRVERLAEADE